MADPNLSTSTPLGEWADALFQAIFCQPDDNVFRSTYETFVSPDLVYRNNHDHFNHDQLLELVERNRKVNLTTTQSNKEILCWDSRDEPGGGCVAHMYSFLLRSKGDGKETKCSALTLANVRICDGRRMLVELTEVCQFG